MMPDATGTTAADAIADVRSALHSLVGPSGLSILPSPSASRSPSPSSRNHKEASLHPLSRVPLAAARRQLSTALDALKGAASARESWVHPEKAERLLHVKRDTVVKTRAIRASKAALVECRRLAATGDPFATPVALAIHRLRAVAVAANAITTEESSETPILPTNGQPATTRKDRVLTVCGTKFLADFHFFDLAAETTNVKVKFRHLTANDSEIGDDDIDASFAQLIQRQDFDTLKKAFEKLIAQEKLSADVSQHISLIDALRCFEDDLIAAHQAEAAASQLDKKLPGEDTSRLGHGIIKRSALGLNIVFMKGHSALLGVEDAIPPREISVSRSHPTLRQDTGPFEFAEAKMFSVGAQYVLTFQKPILVCLSVAQNLERVAGAPNHVAAESAMSNALKSSTGDRDVFGQRSDSRSEDDTGKKVCWPSLQKLLAPVVFGGQDGSDGEGNGNVGKEGTTVTPAKEVVKKRVHWSQHSTEFIAAAALTDNYYVEFSHSGSDTIPGLAVHRVPLCHPKNVLPIFGLIRQQLVFNELFQSCFGSPVYTNPTLKPFQPQPVEVVLSDAPSFLQFSMYDNSMDDILSMAVTVEVGGDISVTLTASSDQPHVCSDAKATAILRVSRSIPLTILTIVKLGTSGASRT